MEHKGILQLPPVESLVTVHLHSRLSLFSSRIPMLPYKSDRFQSALTEKTCKVTALNERALNVLSLLTDFTQT